MASIMIVQRNNTNRFNRCYTFDVSSPIILHGAATNKKIATSNFENSTIFKIIEAVSKEETMFGRQQKENAN